MLIDLRTRHNVRTSNGVLRRALQLFRLEYSITSQMNIIFTFNHSFFFNNLLLTTVNLTERTFCVVSTGEVNNKLWQLLPECCSVRFHGFLSRKQFFEPKFLTKQFGSLWWRVKRPPKPRPLLNGNYVRNIEPKYAPIRLCIYLENYQSYRVRSCTVRFFFNLF